MRVWFYILSHYAIALLLREGKGNRATEKFILTGSVKFRRLLNGSRDSKLQSKIKSEKIYLIKDKTCNLC